MVREDETDTIIKVSTDLELQGDRGFQRQVAYTVWGQVCTRNSGCIHKSTLRPCRRQVIKVGTHYALTKQA